MKSIFISAFALGIALVSCTKTSTSETNQASDTLAVKNQRIEFAYDSLVAMDSLNVSDSVSAKFKQKVLVFTGLDKPVLDSLYKSELYDSIAPDVAYSRPEVQSLLEERKSQYYTQTKADVLDFRPGSRQVWDRVSEMNVVGNENGYLTVHYTGYGYTGGAHGYAYDLYKVVDIENQKRVELKDIVALDKVDWNKVLLKEADERKENFFEPEKLSYNKNFFFDEKGLSFTYNQYEIAAYVYGIITITVPYAAISSALTPEFKERMGIQ
ncbi:RsiV family protein [Chryseobacterium sp. A301]